MAGGKLQLLVRGNQDTPLIGNPQITFFKQLYRKHTNFSIDSLQQSISGEPKFNNNYKITFEHYGELLSNIYCHVNLPELNITGKDKDYENGYLSWVNGIGYTIFEELQLNIGEQKIDTQTGEWLFLNDQLNGNLNSNNSSELYYNHIANSNTNSNINSNNNNNNYSTNTEPLIKAGNIQTLNGSIQTPNKFINSETNISNNDNNKHCDREQECNPSPTKNNQVSFITNFKFWFCKYLGCAIPLIAIPNLDVTLTIKNRAIKDLINTNSSSIKDFMSSEYYDEKNKCYSPYSYYDNFIFYGEYIFLDNDEKRRFAQNNHKYLIEQIQQQPNINFILKKGNYISKDSIENPFLNCPYKYNQLSVRLDFNNPVKYIIWVPHMINNKSFDTKKSQYLENGNNISVGNHISVKNTCLNGTCSQTKSDYNCSQDCCCECSLVNDSDCCPNLDTEFNNNYLNYSMFKPPANIPINYSEIFLFESGQLFMENIPRTPNMPAKFFANIFQKRYFNNVALTNYIYVYSFSINPNDHQPSGSCNFSKLSNVNLTLNDLNLYDGYDYTNSYMNIYACSYNILTIQSGNCYIEYPI